MTPCHSAVTAIKAILFSISLGAALPAWAEMSFDCVVQPNRTIAVGSPATGILSAVEVSRGDRVRKGQLLARLEAELETATVKLHELRAGDDANEVAQLARLALIQGRVERTKNLLDRGATTRESYDQALAELAVTEAELERLKTQRNLAKLELKRAEATLARRSISSHIDGVVTHKMLSAGEFVSQDTAILQIADLDPLHVEVFLPIIYHDQLFIGQTASVALRQPALTQLKVTVEVIDSVFDATSDTFGVRLALPNADQSLPAGQRCKATIDITPVADGAVVFGSD